MARELYTEDIDKHVDWNGDETTSGKPVRGDKVQKFIKDTLEARVGYVFTDTSEARCYAFPDEEAYQEWERAGRVENTYISTWEAPANYSAEITDNDNAAIRYVAVDDKDIYLNFTPRITNKSGQNTNESVSVTITYSNNGTNQIVTNSYLSGTAVSVLMDNYLQVGTNSITIKITGASSKATTSIGITVYKLALSLSSTFQFNTPFNTGYINVPYHIEGNGTKTVEIYVDGTKVADSSTYATKTDNSFNVSILADGLHTIQLRAFIDNSGTAFYSRTLYYQVVVGVIDGIEFAMGAELNRGALIASDETISLVGEQFARISFDWAIITSRIAMYQVVFNDGVKDVSSVTTSNGQLHTFTYLSRNAGEVTMTVHYGSAQCQIPITFTPSTLKISDYLNDLILDLTAEGRTNSDTDKSSWVSNGYTSTFNNFAWSKRSGWNGEALIVSNGATLDVNIRPFSFNPTSRGLTIEIEFETADVEDEEAVVCRCGTGDSGLTITPVSATLRATGGSEISTLFKNNERIRLAFVINPFSGVTDLKLLYIVNNGINERGKAYATQNDFNISDTLHFYSTDATIKIYNIRIYQQAVSEGNLLNNRIINSDRISELYEKNDIYEDGKVSLTKLKNMLPVMCITHINRSGNPTLLSLSDKNTRSYNNVEYTNPDDPSRNFTATNMRWRLQGTSSLKYPRKNFRLYPKYCDAIYDADGNEITSKKYSFKQGSIPVTCFCLKADAAESSGTHNTGIAKLVNDAMKNMRISSSTAAKYGKSYDTEYLGKTQAQKNAEDNGYAYDVRTCVDGFPIVCFYRYSDVSDWIFLGQYNFNNDKSTEDVFGFTGENATGNSECWECVDNTNTNALFTDISNWYSDVTDDEGNTVKGWERGFEARYPDDGSDADTTNLYAFAQWLVGSTVGSQTFTTEKWSHIDVWKMAAYYVYLMRFAGADQFVKNSMLTTEDGIHWYYINYDNDTVMGLENNGDLTVAFNADRQTQAADETYVFAGHNSKLWNCLEGDEEFMSIVKDVDQALYPYYNYESCCDMFDRQQSDRWCEAIYNENGRYKYIEPYLAGTDYLAMLQGSRKSHRHYWLSHRFEMLDARWGTGGFIQNSIEFKCNTGTVVTSDKTIIIVAGKKLNYAWGLDNTIYEHTSALEANATRVFTPYEQGVRELAIGNSVCIYPAPCIESIDVSDFADTMREIHFSKAANGFTGCYLKRLIVGGASVNNQLDFNMDGLTAIDSVEYIDIRGFHKITSLDISTLLNLHTFLAENSGITSFIPSSGCVLENVSLPSSIQTLELVDISIPTINTFNYTPTANLQYLTIDNVKGDGMNSLPFIMTWLNAIDGDEELLSTVELTAKNVAWSDVSLAHLYAIGAIQHRTLSGVASLASTPHEEDLQRLISLYGTDCFRADAVFMIDAEGGTLFYGPNTLKSGEESYYGYIGFPITGGSSQYSLLIPGGVYNQATGLYEYDTVTLNPETGLLKTTESGNDCSFVIRAKSNFDDSVYFDKQILVEARTYPESVIVTVNRENLSSTSQDCVFTAQLSPEIFDGTISVAWSWNDNNFYKVSEWKEDDNTYCARFATVYVSDRLLEVDVTATFTTYIGGTVSDSTYIVVSSKAIAMTDRTNMEAMIASYDAGFSNSSRVMSVEECQAITNLGTAYSGSGIVTFNELKFFTGLTSIPSGAFEDCTALTEITIPDCQATIGDAIFEGCTHLEKIALDYANWSNKYVGSGTVLEEYAVGPENTNLRLFDGIVYNILGTELYAVPTEITSITFENTMTAIHAGALAYSKITSLEIPTAVTVIPDQMCEGCTELVTSILSTNTISVGSKAFYGCSKLKKVDVRTSSVPSLLNINAFTGTLITGTTGYIYATTDTWEYFKVATNWINYAANIAAYINFEDAEVRKICCNTWGDYIETKVTTTIADDSEIVTITTITTPVSMKNTTATRGTSVSETTTRAKEEGEEAGSTTTTTKTPVEMTTLQAAAVSSIGTAFRNNTTIRKFNEFRLFTNVTSTSSNAFGSSGISEFTVSPNFRTFGYQTFAYCTNLTEIRLTEGVTTLGDQWLWAAKNITLIDLPSTVTTITSAGIHTYSSSGQKNYIVICRAVTPPTLGSSNYLTKLTAVYVSDESVDAYKAATKWKDFASKIRPLSEYVG